ncbi:MAG: GIY-YIG nuclease family protein [Ignavibacteria bacterium]|nr:GIY-YIG nuclease family protein [Ignavibacteria bacterium]
MGTPIYDTTFIVCDVETTGMSSDFNRITEIGLIKIYNGEIIDKFTSLVNPQQHIPSQITYLTGITNEDVMDKPTFGELSPQIHDFIFDKSHTSNGADSMFLFTGHNVAFDYNFIKKSFLRAGHEFDFNLKTICTCKLARRLLKKLKSKSLYRVAEYFEIRAENFHRAFDDTLVTSKILLKFLDILNEEYELETTEEVLKFQNTKIYTAVNKSPILKRIKANIKDFPKLPGVYFMKSSSGEIIYIGKAKSLRERLSTYLNFSAELPPKIRNLIQAVHSIEYEVTDSELSALILESKMIKKHKPRFNTAIKRYKFHPYLKIDVQNQFPKIEKVYEIENDGANYYGPFSSGRTVNRILKQVNDIYKLRKCEYKYLRPTIKHSTCMYYDIGKCNAPCNLTQSKKEYKDEVMRTHEFITGDGNESIQKFYERQMIRFSEEEDYERAAFLRDRLKDIQRVMSYQKVITSAINNKKIIIKQKYGDKEEIFFIHNGKLMKTYTITMDEVMDENMILDEIFETTEYLFFSLSKFIKHKFTAEDLDEIKVISNWLAVNRDKSIVLEIDDTMTKEEIIKWIMKN